GTTPGALDGPFTAAGFVAATRALPDGPRVVSLVPTQLHRLLADADGTAAAASYHAILLGGAAAGPDLLDRAGDAGLRLVTTYGMSETAGGCVYDGRPLPGVEVLLDDDRIVLQGPVVARGYRHRPGYPAFEHDTRGRRFRTSDLGRWTDGRLQVLGRADDVLV